MNKINLVNSISFFRLFSAPVILWMILEDKLTIAFWIFFLAALSDTIDGFLARKLKLITEFGKILDPLSDKILIFSVFISLSYKDMLAVPIIIIIILRDFVILLGTVISLLFKKKFSYSPLKIGKITFFFQSLYAGVLLCHYSNLYNLEFVIKYFGLFIIYITLISGILYLIRWFKEVF
mgnify:CR=1 FL=1